MATKKRKTTTRRSTSRKKRAEQRLPAGLGTLFAGLLLVGLAFVEGDSVWKTLHQVLFGLFGCGSFVLGAAVCCLAVLYTRGEDLLPHICKLALGLVFASGTVIVFSDIQPQGLSAFQMVAACYQNGYQAWLSGGALGAVLGGNLLLLCGRPAANFIMLVLALCVSLYIFDLTPAEVWQWLCDVSGGVHAKGVAVYEQGAAAVPSAAPSGRPRRKPQTSTTRRRTWKNTRTKPKRKSLSVWVCRTGCPVCCTGAIR